MRENTEGQDRRFADFRRTLTLLIEGLSSEISEFSAEGAADRIIELVKEAGLKWASEGPE